MVYDAIVTDECVKVPFIYARNCVNRDCLKEIPNDS